jgi:hypothetical protein
MGLLDKLQTQGSVLTNLDGSTPTGYYDIGGVTNYPKQLAGSQLDLDGKKPVEYDQLTDYPEGLRKSQLDFDGLTPKIAGKYPYLDNLPK